MGLGLIVLAMNMRHYVARLFILQGLPDNRRRIIKITQLASHGWFRHFPW